MKEVNWFSHTLLLIPWSPNGQLPASTPPDKAPTEAYQSPPNTTGEKNPQGYQPKTPRTLNLTSTLSTYLIYVVTGVCGGGSVLLECKRPCPKFPEILSAQIPE